MKRRLKDTAGFTLVELIVVIAILGILTAIAVPTYSGYVKKANIAADQTLLASVNSAFTAACLEEGVDMTDIATNGAKLTMSDGCVTGVVIDTAAAKPAGFSDAEFNEAFLSYYGANAATPMKVYTNSGNFKYNSELRAFGIVDGEMRSETYTLLDGSTVTLNFDENRLNAYKDSFFGNMDQGVLMGNVDAVVGWAENKVGLLANLKDDDGYVEFLKTTMGYSEDFINDSANNRALLNSLVLYTAKETSKLDADALYETFYNGSATTGSIAPNLDGGTQDIAAYAMQYALGMAYMRDTGKYVDGVTQPGDVFAALTEREFLGEDPETREPSFAENTYFQEWLDENGQDSLNGYLGAMDIIAGNVDSIDDPNKLLEGGYTNGNLQDLLTQVLGK